jgi:hypothetical protein
VPHERGQPVSEGIVHVEPADARTAFFPHDVVTGSAQAQSQSFDVIRPQAGMCLSCRAKVGLHAQVQFGTLGAKPDTTARLHGSYN